MRNLLELGYSMVLWPDGIEQKDINEMIMSGKTKEELKEIINNNTYQGTLDGCLMRVGESSGMKL